MAAQSSLLSLRSYALRPTSPSSSLDVTVSLVSICVSELRVEVTPPRSTPSGRVLPRLLLPSTKSTWMSRARRRLKTFWSGMIGPCLLPILGAVSPRNLVVVVLVLGFRNHIVDRRVLGIYGGYGLVGNDNLFWFLSLHTFEDFKLWFCLCS